MTVITSSPLPGADAPDAAAAANGPAPGGPGAFADVMAQQQARGRQGEAAHGARPPQQPSHAARAHGPLAPELQAGQALADGLAAGGAPLSDELFGVAREVLKGWHAGSTGAGGAVGGDGGAIGGDGGAPVPVAADAAALPPEAVAAAAAGLLAPAPTGAAAPADGARSGGPALPFAAAAGQPGLPGDGLAARPAGKAAPARDAGGAPAGIRPAPGAEAAPAFGAPAAAVAAHGASQAAGPDASPHAGPGIQRGADADAGDAAALALPAAHDTAAQAAVARPASATLATPLGSAAWAGELGGQLTQQALWHSRIAVGGSGKQQVELKLNPADLGPLQVTLSVSDGVAHAAFVSLHPAVRSAVESALPQLQQALAQAGLSLGQASVGDGQPQHGGSGQPGDAPRAGGPAAAAAAAAATAQPPGAAAARPVRVNALLDTFA